MTRPPEELDHLRDLLDHTDAVLPVSDEVLAHADQVVQSTRRWFPGLVLAAGVGAAIVAILVGRRRGSAT